MVPGAQCSSTSCLRSAGRCGLELAHATGKHVMKRCDFLCPDERSNTPSLQLEERAAGFLSGFTAKKDFLGKAKRNHRILLGSETWGNMDHSQWSKERREGAPERSSYFAQDRCLDNREANGCQKM